MVSITFLKTPDGAKLALYHYKTSESSPHQEPVFLISGFGLNRISLDLNEKLSWPKHLSKNGHDTWILEVRGSGRSKLATGRDGSFDDYLKDAALSVEHILKVTGSKKLHWVGYSLGGMLLYSYLSTYGESSIRSGVAIESPFHLRDYQIGEKNLKLLKVLNKLPFKKVIPYKIAGKAFIPFAPLFYKSEMFSKWMNVENMEMKHIPKIMFKTFDNVPVALALQFASWSDQSTYMCREGKTDYLKNISEVKTPILILSGVGDFAERAKIAVNVLQAAEHVEFLKSNGFSADYGHSDFIFGKEAPKEVLSRIHQWIENHSESGLNLAITK